MRAEELPRLELETREVRGAVASGRRSGGVGKTTRRPRGVGRGPRTTRQGHAVDADLAGLVNLAGPSRRDPRAAHAGPRGEWRVVGSPRSSRVARARRGDVEERTRGRSGAPRRGDRSPIPPWSTCRARALEDAHDGRSPTRTRTEEPRARRATPAVSSCGCLVTSKSLGASRNKSADTLVSFGASRVQPPARATRARARTTRCTPRILSIPR